MRALRDDIAALADAFAGRVRIVTIYIAEAHAREEWPIGDHHSKRGVLSLAQARSLAERRAAARLFARELEWPHELLVDGMDDAFEHMFAAWPMRFVVVAADGKTIAHVAQPAPGEFTYSPASLAAPLQAALARPLAAAGSA